MTIALSVAQPTEPLSLSGHQQPTKKPQANKYTAVNNAEVETIPHYLLVLSDPTFVPCHSLTATHNNKIDDVT